MAATTTTVFQCQPAVSVPRRAAGVQRADQWPLGAVTGCIRACVVNVVTKSGTNQIHGDLFEFVRNGAFNARNFFAAAAGYAAAQPVRRHRGRADQEGQAVRFLRLSGARSSAPRRPRRSVSCRRRRRCNGDFSALESAACQSTHTHRAITDPNYRPAVPERQVPPAASVRRRSIWPKYLPAPAMPCGQ